MLQLALIPLNLKRPVTLGRGFESRRSRQGFQAAALTVPERTLLFCLAPDTDWQAASVTHATAAHMMARRLIEHDAPSQFS
jgi:hypothetical protein